jgi:dihydrofolate synthase/folylpolyglutamate synthase
MIAALLEAHGVATGAYVSPHISSWAERIRIRGKPIADLRFDAAVEAAAHAIEVTEPALDGERVTQFEAATLAAFQAFATAPVDVAVLEAGLGGRLDATNVVTSRMTVLTSVGLDHTQWLGDTVAEIAEEKLSVLDRHTVLVAGALEPEIRDLAIRTCEERQAKFVPAPLDADPDLPHGAPAFQRRNFALALAATKNYLGRLDGDSTADVATGIEIPGRAERVEGEPPLILDAAHNPDGARALSESLPELAAGRPVIGCIAVLDDKDARGILGELAPACERLVLTEVPEEALSGTAGPRRRSRPAAELQSLCAEIGVPAEVDSDARRAVDRAGDLAKELGGVALIAGSHYLLRELWIARHAPSS